MAIYRKVNRKKKVVKSKRRPKVGLATVKSIVKRAIARQIENKGRQYFNTGVNIIPTGDLSAFDGGIFPLHPYTGFVQIDQGTGQGARIGNSLTTKKVIFKGTLIPAAYNATTNPYPTPLQVKMYLFYDKRFPTYIPTPATNEDFFQYNNTSTGFSNDLVDLWRPVNLDSYRVLYTRTFKLGHASVEGQGSLPGNQYNANNDFKMNCNFSVDITKYLIKTVKFDDNNSNTSTRGLFCMFVPVYATGIPINPLYRPAQVQWMVDYNYEDA